MLAVIVTTREQLGLLIAVMTDATGHLLLEISNNWIRSFRHYTNKVRKLSTPLYSKSKKGIASILRKNNYAIAS